MHDALLATIRHYIALAPAEEALIREWFVPETLAKGDFFLRAGDGIGNPGPIRALLPCPPLTLRQAVAQALAATHSLVEP